MPTYLKSKYLWITVLLFGATALGYWLGKIFTGQIILRQGFNLWSLPIHFYGLTMAGAVLAGILIAQARAKNYEINPSVAEDLLFWLIIGGFVGARLYHVASSWQFYLHNPNLIYQVWRGGLSIFGALLGGLVTLWIYTKMKPLPPSFLSLLDWLAPSVVLGQIIGRFGNLFNYEAFGYPSVWALKMFVPLEFRPFGYESVSFFQPLFLYEAVACAVILVFLLLWARRHSFASIPGRLFFSYLFLYNVVRFFIEFQRVDSTFFGHWRLNSATSLILIIVGIAGFFLTPHEQKA